MRDLTHDIGAMAVDAFGKLAQPRDHWVAGHIDLAAAPA